MANMVRSHTDLDVFKKAFEVAMKFFELSKSFPKEVRSEDSSLFIPGSSLFTPDSWSATRFLVHPKWESHHHMLIR